MEILSERNIYDLAQPQFFESSKKLEAEFYLLDHGGRYGCLQFSW